MASALKLGLMGAAQGFLEGTLDLWKTERARAAKELENQRLQQLHDRDQAEQYARQDAVYAQRRQDELTDQGTRRKQELEDQKAQRSQRVADTAQEQAFRREESRTAREESAANRRAAAEQAVADRAPRLTPAKLPNGQLGLYDPLTGKFESDANGNPVLAPERSNLDLAALLGGTDSAAAPASPTASNPAAMAAVPLRDRRTPGSSRDNPLVISDPSQLRNLTPGRGTFVRTPDGMVRQF